MLVNRVVKECELIKDGDDLCFETVTYLGKRVGVPTFETKSEDVFALVDKIKAHRDNFVKDLVESGHHPRDVDVNVLVVDHKDGIVRMANDGKLAITFGMYYLHKPPLDHAEIGF